MLRIQDFFTFTASRTLKGEVTQNHTASGSRAKPGALSLEDTGPFIYIPCCSPRSQDLS